MCKGVVEKEVDRLIRLKSIHNISRVVKNIYMLKGYVLSGRDEITTLNKSVSSY